MRRGIKVFVYGTLKRGGRLHSVMDEIGAEFIGKSVLRGYRMIDTGFGFPCIVPTMRIDGNVYGEVYTTDSDGLAALDQTEGEGTLYRRREEVTVYGAAFVYTWLGSIAGMEQITSGVWKNPSTESMR